MPIIKEPLKVDCFQCGENFEVKFVQSRRDYSQKNNWDYWTNDQTQLGKRICNKCLINLYKNYKKEFRQLVADKKKQALLRHYITDGKISEQEKPNFILGKK